MEWKETWKNMDYAKIMWTGRGKYKIIKRNKKSRTGKDKRRTGKDKGRTGKEIWNK